MPKPAKYTEQQLILAVKESKSFAQVMRIIGIKPSGGSHSHISRRIKRLGLDTSHFTGKAHGSANLNARLTPEQILVNNPLQSQRRKPEHLRRALLEIGRNHECERCKCSNIWQDLPLSLHVDHINGNFRDNRPENLRFLCPNCHSQTLNFAGRKHEFQC